MATRKPTSKPTSKDARKRARARARMERIHEAAACCDEHRELVDESAVRFAALLAAIADAEERLQAYADRLRETADQVQRGEINYAHGWNRVRKIADEIASAK